MRKGGYYPQKYPPKHGRGENALVLLGFMWFVLILDMEEVSGSNPL